MSAYTLSTAFAPWGLALLLSALATALVLCVISVWKRRKRCPQASLSPFTTEEPCCVDVGDDDEPIDNDDGPTGNDGSADKDDGPTGNEPESGAVPINPLENSASGDVQSPCVQDTQEEVVKRMRPREHGVEIGIFQAGKDNAITDVCGVKVGHATIIEGDGNLVAGEGPVRTGVTCVIPHDGDIWNDRVTAGAFVLNGNGVVTGLDWINELGLIDGPILLTNTLSVGTVYDAAVDWMLARYPAIGITDDTYIPIVGECDDGSLNDIRGRHVKHSHVFAAIDGASTGSVMEGAVGAGTGMISFRYKGGIGTSSRIVPRDAGGYTVGVLVNSNFGDRHQLRIDGVPVGRELKDELSTSFRDGSICIIVATDAPLSSQQLKRLAARATMGLARTGAIAKNGSGDFVVAFSTGRRLQRGAHKHELAEIDNEQINPLFEAAADATEEAIVNALFMAETVVGRDGNVAHALPRKECLEILRAHGRIRSR